MPLPHPPETPATPGTELPVADTAVQRITLVRRDYNAWVASETMEDYALRYTPQRFRKWSEWRVAHTAFGAASFLVLEAVGATPLGKYGFHNPFWAICLTSPLLLPAGTASPGHSSTPMLLAHACAPLLTGLALGHGEHVLWLVWQLLRPALLGDPAPLTICLGTVATAPPAQLRPSTFHRSPHPRGPPSARHAVS